MTQVNVLKQKQILNSTQPSILCAIPCYAKNKIPLSDEILY